MIGLQQVTRFSIGFQQLKIGNILWFWKKKIYAINHFTEKSCPFRKSCTYLLTIGNPYWSDKGRTPTALHTVTRYQPNWLEGHNIGWILEYMSETICRKQNSIIKGTMQALYRYSDHQPNPRMQKHFVGLFQILLQAAQEQHKGPFKIPKGWNTKRQFDVLQTRELFFQSQYHKFTKCKAFSKPSYRQ